MAKTGLTSGAGRTPASLSANGPVRHVTGLFIMLFLLYMFDYIDREIVSAMFPIMKADLHMTDSQAGSLVSAVYWSIVVLAFPISILVDRWSRKRSVGLMVMLWSIATGLAAFVKTFPQLFLTRLAVGFGEAGYSPGGTAMLSAMYPVEKRSRMMGIWNASIPLGSLIGVVVGGIVATRWGWKHAFGLVAVPGFAIGVLFFFFARDYKTVPLERTVSAARPPVTMSFSDIAAVFLRTPSLLLTYIAFAGNTFLSTAYLTWMPSYFNRAQGLTMEQASLKTASVMFFAIIGAPLGGFLADAWMKRRLNARPLFAALSSLLAAAVWFVSFGLLRGTPQWIAMMAGAVATVLYLSAASAVTQDVVHPGLWAVSYSICVIVQNLLGSSLGPIVLGAISDRYGLPVAMTLAPATSVFAGVLFLGAAAFYRRDLAKVDKVKIEMEA
ncbi:MAG TPA: MFS transporter [Spirochaetia bacterium]|nr:MFS transporter [Spirochaetia bacterium]